MTDHTTVQLPPGLARRVEERVEGTEFTSVDDYVVYVLSEVLEGDETPENTHETPDLEGRLESLGYL